VVGLQEIKALPSARDDDSSDGSSIFCPSRNAPGARPAACAARMASRHAPCLVNRAEWSGDGY
jgi:hypothetical protein